MPISLAFATTAVNVGLGLTGLAKPDGIGLKDAKTALALLKDARQLRAHLVAQPSLDPEGLTRTFKAHADALLTTEFAADARELAIHLEQALPHCIFEDDLLVAADLDAGQITERWLQAIHAGAPDDLKSYFAPGNRATRHRDFFRQIATPFLEAALTKSVTEPAMILGVYRAQLRRLTDIDRKLDASAEREQEILDLVRAFTQANAPVVPEKNLIAMARRIRPEVATLQEALTELNRAVEIAAEQQARLEQGGAPDDPVMRYRRDLAAITDTAARASFAQAQFAAKKVQMRAELSALRQETIDSLLLDRQAASAAALIAEGVIEAAPGSPVEALRAEWSRWYERGRDRGIRLDLDVAVALAEVIIGEAGTPREEADALNNLGLALTQSGVVAGKVSQIEEAIEVLHRALDVPVAPRSAMHEAMTRNNLGLAWQALAQKTGSLTHYQAAVAAYEAALGVFDPDETPVLWARAQDNLGNVLSALGERGGNLDFLVRSAAATEKALSVFSAEREPETWAMAQNNLGTTLRLIGETRDDTALLRKAIDAHSQALSVMAQTTQTMNWGGFHQNRALARVGLGERTGEVSLIEQAIADYRIALEVFLPEQVPDLCAMTRSNLGIALKRLGIMTKDVVALREAAEAFEDALRFRSRSTVGWAMTQGNLAGLCIARHDVTGDPADLDLAQGHLQEAATVFQALGAAGYLSTVQALRTQIEARRAGQSRPAP